MDDVIELEIEQGPEAGTYSVQVLRSVSGGEPQGTMTLDVPALLAGMPLIESTVLASAVAARRVVGDREAPLRAMGTQLFESVFAGAVGGAYRASLGVARERGKDLQVLLRLTAPGLAGVPWETLFDPEAGAYVCRKEPLVRHVPAPSSFKPDTLLLEPPLRILGMVSSPSGLARLEVDDERQRLEAALGPHIASGRVELTWLDDVSWDGVHAALLQGHWHVLHFIGHGGYDADTDEGVLAFVGKDGRADYVEASSLADLLDEAEVTPQLVVLNSCQSGAVGAVDPFSGTAAALVRSGIHAVAAMQFAVSDVAAVAFARSFYMAIAHGRSVDEAVRSGRIGILGTGRGTLEWVTPVLYVRGGDTRLFEFDSTTTPSVAAPEVQAPAPPPAPPPVPPPPVEQPASPGADEPAPTKKSHRALIGGGIAAFVASGGLATVLALLPHGDTDAATDPSPSTSVVTPRPVVTVQHEVPATQQWTDMLLACLAGDTLEIVGGGTILHEQSATGRVGPEGLADPGYHAYNVVGLPDAPTAGLIGSLDVQDPFFVGTGVTYVCPRDGELFLGVNDIGLAGNSGAFAATITLHPGS
ncbi:CHAT domain-containing protein [Cellulomonas sp. ICMP 17802]|uniref:CHAT domain-containing protein n=1 Tax=Cellulomonas sp. ICMP 17802 TaxID=3239199 RepID=UPI00351AEAAD